MRHLFSNPFSRRSPSSSSAATKAASLAFFATVLIAGCATQNTRPSSEPIVHRPDESISVDKVQVEALAFSSTEAFGLSDEFAFVDGKTGASLTFEEVLARAEKTQAFLIGESHDQRSHHRLQASLLRGLARKNRPVLLGMEMVDTSRQEVLDSFNEGKLDEDTLEAALEWEESWGHDYNAYKSIFLAAREEKVPLFALNVPRDWVRLVSKTPLEKLSQQEREMLPTMDLSDPLHRRGIIEFFEKHHPKTGRKNAVDGFYRVQVLWDDGMAENAFRLLSYRNPEDASTSTNEGQALLVGIAGSGHLSQYRAIPDRLARRLGASTAQADKVLTLVPLMVDDDEDPLQVAKEAVANREADVLAILKPRKLLSL
ncbi:MAG: ChaN family lipoprotein [Deltaproteobacteria bacterium]|nr:ChaN family lipoprotein [Deltaproteobacteria bacterium]